VFELIDSKQGNKGGTYIHRKLAYPLAQWINPYFAVQVSNILDELLLTGRVELGKEKSHDDLEIAYENKINTIFNRNIDSCPISFYGKDIVYFLKFDIPESLYEKYLPKYPILENNKYICIKFGVTSDVEERLYSHRLDKKKENIIFLHAIELEKRYTASKMEKHMKTIVKQLGIEFQYETNKECAIVDEELFNTLINEVKNGISDMEKEVEEYNDNERPNNNEEIEIKKLELEQEIRLKKLENENDVNKLNQEIELKKLDNDKEMKKLESISELFKNKLITIEEYKDILKSF
jgi:hypothetical protein